MKKKKLERKHLRVIFLEDKSEWRFQLLGVAVNTLEKIKNDYDTSKNQETARVET
mgnify:CR=1 FL=1